MPELADDLNLLDFYHDAGKALTILYDAFPRKIELYVEDIAGPDQEDEFGLHSKRHMACLAALLWLAEEGLLRYSNEIRQEGIDQAVLTAPTLNRLTTPDSLPEPRIHRIKKALKSGSSHALASTLQEFFNA